MTSRLTSFSGIVLAGGESSRMGTDKAFVEVPTASRPDGEPMIAIAVEALVGAGAHDVLIVGGDLDRLHELGYQAVPDDHQGEGPLAGLLTGLRHAGLPIVVVLTCDMPAIRPATVRGLVRTLDAAPDAIAATAMRGGRRQILTAAYRRTAIDPLAQRFAAGERSVRRALDGFTVAIADHLAEEDLIDLDSPEAVERYARAFERPPAS